MKRLFLLRHAKASPDRPGLEDLDRPLIQRGKADAVRIGCFLREEVYVPELILCSTSQRTRQTLELVLPELQVAPAIRHLDALYLAKASAILALVRKTADALGSVMVVGHNPGLEDCARDLVRSPTDRKLRKRYELMTEKFPTAALAVLDFEAASWSDVAGNTGELEVFVRPKDLREGTD